jgi:class III poly(R)-hydroxyalkanoic acid synthase PhaE subunit
MQNFFKQQADWMKTWQQSQETFKQQADWLKTWQESQEKFKQQTDWLKTWQESQQTLNNQYAGWSEKWTETMLGNRKNDPDYFEGWFKSQKGLEEQFREFSTRLNDMISTLWSGKVSPEVLKFMNVSFFEEFYRNWLATLELPGGVKNPLGIEGGWQQATNFLRSFMEKDHPFFSSFSNTKITDQISRVFGMMQGALGKEEGAFSDMMSGYQELFGKLFDSTTAQSTEKLASGFEAWAKEMEKHLSAPKLGINREMAHDMSQALVLSQKYIQSYSKMARIIEETSRKAGVRFQTKLSELALKNKPVNKFADLCALWAVENESVFVEVMNTQEYARIQGDFVDAGHRLKIQWNKLAEKALEPTPIALKRDLDLAIAEIQHMKRTMRTFQNELRNVGKEAQGAREAQSVAEIEARMAREAQTSAEEKVKTAETAAQEAAIKAKADLKAVKAAALEEVKAAKAAAQEEVKAAKAAVKAAEAATKEEAKRVKAAEAELAKRAKADNKTLKTATGTITTTESENV